VGSLLISFYRFWLSGGRGAPRERCAGERRWAEPAAGSPRCVSKSQLSEACVRAPLEVADLVAELLLGALDGGVNLVMAAVVDRDREAVLRHVEGEVLPQGHNGVENSARKWRTPERGTSAVLRRCARAEA
jgi:hypothetical protein